MGTMTHIAGRADFQRLLYCLKNADKDRENEITKLVVLRKIYGLQKR